MGWNTDRARITALLLSFSAVVFFLLARAVLLQPQRRGGMTLADLMLAALDRFLDGRGLLDLATRRNMVLLCHAILLLILRDAGVLGAPARRRGATATTAAVADAEAACSAPPRARTRNVVVVWRRPRQNRAAAAHGAGRLVDRQLPREPRPAEAAAPWAAPALAGPPAHLEDPNSTKQIVLVEQAATNHLAGHDRAAADELEQQAAASATDGNAVADDGERNASTVAEQKEETPELADDRRIEEFIAKQRSKMRQESLQLHLVRSSSVYQQAAIPTC